MVVEQEDSGSRSAQATQPDCLKKRKKEKKEIERQDRNKKRGKRDRNVSHTAYIDSVKCDSDARNHADILGIEEKYLNRQTKC